jgi:hypothetical protein
MLLLLYNFENTCILIYSIYINCLITAHLANRELAERAPWQRQTAKKGRPATARIRNQEITFSEPSEREPRATIARSEEKILGSRFFIIFLLHFFSFSYSYHIMHSEFWLVARQTYISYSCVPWFSREERSEERGAGGGKQRAERESLCLYKLVETVSGLRAFFLIFLMGG